MTAPTEVAASGAKSLGKVGKSVPPVVWVVAIVGGLGLSYVMSRRGGATDTTGDADPTGTSGALVYTGVGGTDDGSTVDTSTTSTKPVTNDEWAQQATTYLLAHNYPATLIDSAIRNYLNGVHLTDQENAIIATALVAIGPTPQLLPPTTTPPVNGSGSSTPAHVDNLRVTASTKSSFSLAWNKATGASKYRLHITGGGLNRTADVTGTTYTFSGLRPVNAYIVHVVGMNTAGTSGPDNSIRVVTKR